MGPGHKEAILGVGVAVVAAGLQSGSVGLVAIGAAIIIVCLWLC
jgi:hypothetical protein